MYEYQAQVTRVTDGDTLALDIDLGLGIHAHLPRVRLAGIDCPELATVEGVQARSFTIDWTAQHGPVFVARTTKDRRDAYGRYLVTLLSLREAGVSLNSDLLQAGYAKPYP